MYAAKEDVNEDESSQHIKSNIETYFHNVNGLSLFKIKLLFHLGFFQVFWHY